MDNAAALCVSFASFLINEVSLIIQLGLEETLHCTAAIGMQPVKR